MAKKGIRNYRLYIEDILECIGKITAYINTKSFEKFSKDENHRCCSQEFEIIGEATRQLPKDVKDKYLDIV